MRLYYISIFSIFLLGLIYLVGTGLLVWFWSGLRQRMRRAWVVMVPLFALLYIGLIAEELWIAWNFGRLCAKDSGIFVYKTVEVEGFYDATRPTLPEPRTKQAAQDLDRGGYRFYEMVLPDLKGGPSKVVHLEKRNGVWNATVLNQPTARYHYKWPHVDSPMSHKVAKIERVVEDAESNELMARETKYKRQAPWFYIGLDRPVMLCPAPGEHLLSKYGSVFNLALKPKQK